MNINYRVEDLLLDAAKIFGRHDTLRRMKKKGKYNTGIVR